MRNEGENIKVIRRCVRDGTLKQPFRAGPVNTSIRIDYAGNFLSKHCDVRPDKKFTWLFDKVDRGLYRLTKKQQAFCDRGY